MQPNDALNYLVMLGIKDFKMNNQKAKVNSFFISNDHIGV